MRNEYRDDTRMALKEGRWTFFKVLPYFIGLIVVAVLIGWGLKATGIIGMDIEREVVQHSQQYTETKASLLLSVYNDNLQLKTEIAELRAADPESNLEIIEAKEAQWKAGLKKLQHEASLIPASEIPDDVRSYMQANPIR